MKSVAGPGRKKAPFPAKVSAWQEKGLAFFTNDRSLLFDSSVFPGYLAFILRDFVAVGPALGELGPGRHVGSDPDVAADNRAVSDPDAPEDIGRLRRRSHYYRE